MAWDFNLDFSKPRKGPATPSFSGDWRGGAAGHQAPQVGAPRAARPAPVVENDSEEEAPDPSNEKPQVKLIRDATKGQLVPEGEEDTAAEKKDSKATDAAAEADDEAGEGEEEEAEEGDDEVDMEAESRNAFLAEASTPELIKQAVAVGGPLADSTKDKWVLDQATQLYFKYDSPRQKMFCWNTSQGCMYHWKERGKMTFLWAAPGGAGTPPPASVEHLAPAVAPAPVAPAVPEVAAQASEPEPSATSQVALWVTIIPPQVLTADFEDANAQAEEEIELNAKAMGAVIGKGGKGIKEIEQATGVKATTLNAREEAGGQRRVVLSGSKAQISQGKSAIEQRIVMVLGMKMAEKVQKHWSSQLLEKKRTETGSEAAKSGVRGLSDFVLEHGLKAVMARKLAKLDAQLQRYMIRHFQPMKAKAVNALRGYLTQLFKYPQRWRLEALYEDGELDGEICETIPLRGSGMVLGKSPEEGEQAIEIEVNTALGQKEASKIYGDVQDQHCRLHRMGNDFYVMALESQIGTLVDGQKIRHHDGPVPLRDGTTLGVGKYLFYCEVGSETFLQERRKKLLAGERFWKEGSASLQRAETEAEAKLAQAAEEGEDEAADADAEGDAEDEEAVDVLFTDGDAEENEDLPIDKSKQNEEQLDAAKRKREEEPPEGEKRFRADAAEEQDAPMPEAVVDEVEELAEVEAPADSG